VFAHHALVLLYGPLAGINAHRWPARPRLALEALQVTPIAWVFNGTFAVSFFFVLSGFVLTRVMGASPRPEKVAQLVTARFMRLLPLVCLGTGIGYVAYGLGAQHLDQLLTLTGNDSQAYMGASLRENHTFFAAVKQMFVVIWRGATAEALFDPPLWSIGVELKGSLLVYLLAGAFAETPHRKAVYWVGILLGLCFMGTSSLSFLAGMYMAQRSRDNRNVLLPLSSTSLVGLSVLALTWASVHPWNRQLWLPLPFNPPEIVDTILSTGGSVVLMAAGLQLTTFRTLLCSRVVQFLGHASYGLYIIHVPILYVGTAPVLSWARRHMSVDAAALLTTGVLLCASLTVGSLLITYIDTPAAKWSKKAILKWLGAVKESSKTVNAAINDGKTCICVKF
jgi:peptidoglycan/LPS O-acetylase OafA/YrhL